MARTLLAVALLALLFAIAFAPAALVRNALPPGSGIEFAAPAGTLWRGQADLLIGGRSAGQLGWRLTPVTILQGALAYDLDLVGPDQALTAVLALRPTRLSVMVDGVAESSFVNRWLETYDINLSGRMTFESVVIEIPYRWRDMAAPQAVPGRAGGVLRWTGGPVRYQLAGQAYQGALPPLEAMLGEGLQGVVFAVGNQTPLLHVELLASGFVRIGMTRLMTRMLNNPWPGGEADHDVVLEVEEQLF